ncbi:helix-turn-helix domain-containing protein [Thorsellia kenyensis]|uniref:Helix-turn-helix domain-containing protein n=1 Tax=Thorsellia kenyensis TaxID=1549888 RepID=A0ABV6C8K5_9GAMM
MEEQSQDWHPADIIAALKKTGTTLAALSREAGLSSSTLSNTLIRPWPKGEWLIAEKIGLHPSEIWPTRYFDAQGNLIDRKSRMRGQAKSA